MQFQSRILVSLGSRLSRSSFPRSFGTVTEWTYAGNDSKDFKISAKKDFAFEGDLLIYSYLKPETKPNSSTSKAENLARLKKNIPKLSNSLTTAIETLLEEEANQKDPVRVYINDKTSIKYLSVVGITKDDSPESLSFVPLGKTINQIAEKANARSVGIIVPSGMKVDKATGQLLTGLHDASYKDFRFKKETEKLLEDKKKGIKEVQFLGITDDSHCASLESITKKASSIASGVNFAKDLVGAPANAKTPLSIAEEAKRIATNSPNMKIDVLGLEECEKLEMGGYLGVQKGSKFPPQFIHLQYSSPKKNENCVKIALIGKGLTFDR
jgi:leucyl aminopeptidase